MINTNRIASVLVEKIYALKGTNQANEAVNLIEEALIFAYQKGRNDFNDELHGA